MISYKAYGKYRSEAKGGATMTPDRPQFPKSNPMQDQDFQWFVQNYQALYKQYGTTYLAIKNKTVLGTFASTIEALNEIRKTEPLGTFIIQHCNGDKSAYTGYIASRHFMN